MSEVTEAKPKRKYTRKGTVGTGATSASVLEEVPTLELTPMNSFAGLEFEEPKPEPPAVNPSLTGIRALTKAEEKRHAEMQYLIGIIDALAVKHAHRNNLTMQQVKDDLITAIIRQVQA